MDDGFDAEGRRSSAGRPASRLSDGEVDVPTGAAALAKGLSLLNLVADAPQPLRFADLLRQSGLPKPTFARILKTLTAFGLIRQDEQRGTYALGPRFLELSHRVWDSFDLLSASRAELERLAQETGETVALCALSEGEVQYLDERAPGGLAVRVEVGRRVPAYCTAAGKALLAWQEPAKLRALVDRQSFQRHTPQTIVDPAMLEADLTLTRARGYAVSYEEHLPGVNSVATVVAGRNGEPIGALVILGPTQRLDSGHVHPMGRELMASARRVTGASGAVAISSRPRPRPRDETPGLNLSCVLPWGAQLGEAPVWDAASQRLLWVDILHPALYRFDPATGLNEICNPAKLVSAVMPAEHGRLIAATQDGLEWLDFDSRRTEPFVHPEAGMSENRLNDAKVGPGGAIWVGSMRMDASRPSGSLYRVTPDGVVAQLETGLTVSNGLGWSPDGRTFYFVDTVPGVIYAYETAPGEGRLWNRRVFARIPAEEGRPDGLTVDAEGHVWCAIWDGWRVNRYRPDGKLDRSIDLPVPRPTSVAFGGEDLSTLYITTARTRLPAGTLTEAPLSGGLFACRPGVGGLPVPQFRAAPGATPPKD